MKPEVSEKLFIEELFSQSKSELKDDELSLENIERLTGDASTRRYYRLFTNDGNSFVACLDNRCEDDSNPFVLTQRFLNKHNVRVPNIYDINLKKGYILEEDLGDKTLLQKLASVGSVEEELLIYKKIIDDLVKIHLISDAELEGSHCSKLAFDFTKYTDEIDFSLRFFIEKFLKIEEPRIMSELKREFAPICKRLASEKRVLTHRDFHSRNVMVKDDEYIIIDFQDARMGIPQYDLASLLDDCYYDLSVENKEELKKYYFNRLPQDSHGQGSYANFNELYDDMVIQRVFKAIGSFSYIYMTRKDERYLKYIGFAMEKLKTVMLQNERFSPLRKLLFSVYYES